MVNVRNLPVCGEYEDWSSQVYANYAQDWNSFDTQGQCSSLPNSFSGDFIMSPGSWGVSYCGNKDSFLKSRCQPSCTVEIARPRNLLVWSLRGTGGKWRRSMPTKIPNLSGVYPNSSHNSSPASLFCADLNSSTNYFFSTNLIKVIWILNQSICNFIKIQYFSTWAICFSYLY